MTYHTRYSTRNAGRHAAWKKRNAASKRAAKPDPNPQCFNRDAPNEELSTTEYPAKDTETPETLPNADLSARFASATARRARAAKRSASSVAARAAPGTTPRDFTIPYAGVFPKSNAPCASSAAAADAAAMILRRNTHRLARVSMPSVRCVSS